MIRKEHGKWVLRSPHSGRVLGRHPSRVGAQRQETAINLSRARAAGHDVPPPRRRRAKRR